jgi:anthranilate phosphoribosyltransferase
VQVADAQESKTLLLQALDNVDGAARDIVLLNAGAALYVADLADSIASGIEKARIAVSSGAARAKLDQFVAATRRLSGR